MLKSRVITFIKVSSYNNCVNISGNLLKEKENKIKNKNELHQGFRQGIIRSSKQKTKLLEQKQTTQIHMALLIGLFFVISFLYINQLEINSYIIQSML